MAKTIWQSIGGLTRDHFPIIRPNWSGPEEPEAVLTEDDDIQAIRAVFTSPDGLRKLATVRFLSRTAKHTLTRLPARAAPTGETGA